MGAFPSFADCTVAYESSSVLKQALGGGIYSASWTSSWDASMITALEIVTGLLLTGTFATALTVLGAWWVER